MGPQRMTPDSGQALGLRCPKVILTKTYVEVVQPHQEKPNPFSSPPHLLCQGVCLRCEPRKGSWKVLSWSSGLDGAEVDAFLKCITLSPVPSRQHPFLIISKFSSSSSLLLANSSETLVGLRKEPPLSYRARWVGLDSGVCFQLLHSFPPSFIPAEV